MNDLKGENKMTYPPKEFYKEDMRKTKSTLKKIFNKHLLVALIITTIVYYIIDKLILWLK